MGLQGLSQGSLYHIIIIIITINNIIIIVTTSYKMQDSYQRKYFSGILFHWMSLVPFRWECPTKALFMHKAGSSQVAPPPPRPFAD
jgi:hypothetical protein